MCVGAIFNKHFQTLRYVMMNNWPVGLMDKASASGAGDSRFESWAGHFLEQHQPGCHACSIDEIIFK